MYSLTINFGPTGTAWALLFKEEAKAEEAYNAYMEAKMNGADRNVLIGSDDFGQAYAISVDEIHGVVLEVSGHARRREYQRAGRIHSQQHGLRARRY